MATILLVDDDPLLRGSLAEDLGAHAHEVAVAETGAHALAFLERLPIDLLLTDLRLPDLTGVALLHEVRARTPEVQVIIMTAFGDIPTAVKAIQDGAYHFLPKPFDLEELHPILARALETQRLRREVATLRAHQFGDPHIPGLLGESRAIRDLRLLIRRVLVPILPRSRDLPLELDKAPLEAFRRVLEALNTLRQPLFGGCGGGVGIAGERPHTARYVPARRHASCAGNVRGWRVPAGNTNSEPEPGRGGADQRDSVPPRSASLTPEGEKWRARSAALAVGAGMQGLEASVVPVTVTSRPPA